MHGAQLIVPSAHAHGALRDDDGVRDAVQAHAGELLVVRGALLSDDSALHGALHGRPLADLDDFNGHCDDVQLSHIAVELLLDLVLVEIAQRNLLRVGVTRRGAY